MTTTYADALVSNSVIGDAKELLDDIRPEDLQEILALRDPPLLDALEFGISLSSPCYSARTTEGKLAMVFGVVPYPGEEQTGVVWMLGTTHMESIQYRFLRESRYWLEHLFNDRYEILFNIVDKRNIVHVNWLRWLGFKMKREVNAGRNQETFIEFYKSKDV